SIARQAPTAPATIFTVLFDNAHAETAGNADWIISTSQPDPLAENPNPQVETDWTGGISAWGVALQRTGRYSLKTNTSALNNGSDRNNDGWDSLHIFNDLMNNGGAGTDPFGIQFDVLDINSENPSNDTSNPDPVLQGPFGTANSSIIRDGTTETINPAHNPN